MVRWIVFAVLALPAAELIVFILVASGIGFLRAVALQIVLSVVGYCLLRTAGTGRSGRISPSIHARTLWFDSDAGTITRSFAGLLLLVPGFLSDIAGMALLLPPVREWLARRVRTIVPQPPSRAAPDSGAQPGGKVVDLERDDWRRVAESAPVDRRETRPNGDRSGAD